MLRSLVSSSIDDRNVLFAAFAVHLDFLDPTKLVEVWQNWKNQGKMPLADFLVARGQLNSQDRKTIEGLIERKLLKHDGRVDNSLADLADPRTREALKGLATLSDSTCLAHELPPNRNGRVHASTLPGTPDASDTRRPFYGRGRLRRVRHFNALAVMAVVLVGVLAIGLLSIPYQSREKVGQVPAPLETANLPTLPPRGMPVAKELLEESDRRREDLYPESIARIHEYLQNGKAAEARTLLEQQLPPRPESADQRGFEWYYLNRSMDFNPFEMHVGTGPLSGLAYCAGGARLLTLSASGREQVRDASSGELISEWTKGTVNPLAYAITTDGKHLATASGGGALFVHDAELGRLEWSVPSAHQDVIRSLAFSPDGKSLASASNDRTIALWNADALRVATFRGHTEPVVSIAFNHDGKLLASLSMDRTLKLWDVQDALEIRSIDCSPSTPFLPGNIRFSPNGTRLAVGISNSIEVFDLKGELISTLAAMKDSQVLSLTFNPNGTRIASATADGLVHLWRAEGGQELLSFPAARARHLTFSPDGSSLAGLVSGPASNARPVEDYVAIWEAKAPPADRLTRREATRLVDRLFTLYVNREEIKAKLRDNPWLNAATLNEALALAEKHARDPVLLNNTSWGVVREPGRSSDEYARALGYAKEAVAMAPTLSTYVNTLGVAHFRMGSYAEALQTIQLSSQLSDHMPVRHTMRAIDTRNGTPAYIQPGTHNLIPADVAFLAMASFKLGQTEHAKEYLQELRKIMQRPTYQGTDDTALESQAFLKEAEALIEPRGP